MLTAVTVEEVLEDGFLVVDEAEADGPSTLTALI